MSTSLSEWFCIGYTDATITGFMSHLEMDKEEYIDYLAGYGLGMAWVMQEHDEYLDFASSVK